MVLNKDGICGSSNLPYGGVSLTLDEVKRGQTVRIISLPGGFTGMQAIRIGIAEGIVVTCRESVPGGPVIISRYNRDIAVGRELASIIRVENVSTP